MTPRVSFAAIAATLLLSSFARADDEPPPPPTPGPENVDPQQASPDAPLPPPAPSDIVMPRPTEAPIAPEPELVPPRFGAANEWVFTAGFGLDVEYTTYHTANEANRLAVSFSPGFDYFAVRNFSVGASLYVSHAVSRFQQLQPGGANGVVFAATETKTTTFGGGPRFGYAIALGRWLTLYPRLTIGFAGSSTTGTTATAASFGSGRFATPREDAPYVDGFLPLLLHPSSNFFIGVGPSVYHSFTSGPASADRTTVSLETLIGGYFGGDPVTPDRAGYPLREGHPPKRYRFGQQSDVLLGGDFAVGGFVTSRGSSSPSGAVTIAPSIDYFLFDHVSLGLGVGFSYQTSSARSTKGLGVDARVGVQMTLGGRFSFYPRATLGVTYEDVVGVGARESRVLRATLYAPFVFHVAPHFYLGWGPLVVHDLSRTYGLDTTSVGASTMLGGWL